MKMRRFLILVLLIVITMTLVSPLGLTVHAADLTDGDYIYTLFGASAYIKNYTGSGGDVTIPQTLGGYPVTAIQGSAFSSNSTLTSVIIPDGVISIGDWAFSQNDNLASVIIPDSVITIGNYAFCVNPKLKEVIIPDSVTILGEGTFCDCHSLSKADIGDGVTSIGDWAFSGCENLQQLTLGDNIVSIGDGAFTGCLSLQSVDFYGKTAPTFGTGCFSNLHTDAQAYLPVGSNYSNTSEPFITQLKMNFTGFDISEGNITVAPGTNPNTYKITYGSSQTTTADFANTIPISITGTTTTNKVLVNGVLAGIKLHNLNIQPNGASDAAFSIVNGANATLTLSGRNTLQSTGANAGLSVTNGQSVTIMGEGSLTVIGGVGGAGIGGGGGDTGGAVTILSPAIVMAASSGTIHPAIDPVNGALEAGTTAKVVMGNFSTQQTANTTTEIYARSTALLYRSFSPDIAYKSIAFTVPGNDTYQLTTADKSLLHEADKNFVIVNDGLTTFDPVTKDTTVYNNPGLFMGKYGKSQVFDAYRNPAYPTAGNMFEISGIRNVIDATTALPVNWGTNNDRYVQFVDTAIRSSLKFPSAYTVKLNLYEADGTFVKTISTFGTIWAIDSIGFLYEEQDTFGCFITNAQGYAYGSTVSYTPASGLVTDAGVLKNYMATTTVLAEGENIGIALTAAKGAAASLLPADYTTESWEAVSVALALPEGTDAEISAKLTAINDAVAGLITVGAANSAKVATVRNLIEGTAFSMTQAGATNEADVKTAVEAKIAALALDGVAAAVTKVSYTLAVAGDAGTPAGKNGTYTFTVGLSKGAASDTTTPLSMTITATPYTAPPYVVPSSGSDATTAPITNKPQTDADVLINGSAFPAGNTANTFENGVKTTTVTIDQQPLDQKLKDAGSNSKITIHDNTVTDVLIGQLNGQTVKNLENKQATIEIKTQEATYTIPAQQINIDAISEQIGQSVELKDIKVRIEIAKTTQQTVKTVENSAKAGELTLIAPPVEFNIICTYGEKSIEVGQFNSYVERTVAVPEGVDHSKITTGVIIDADGKMRHVPTRIIIIDGRYYAKINSLTNSTYSVIWNPIEFKDVEQHWAKSAVNDMGSRLVISGVGNELFNPDNKITRAEFAAIVVRSLGLKPGTGNNPFMDVKSADWFCAYIETAYKYGIISGYGNGKFGPMDKITREQAMKMIAGTMKITGLKVNFKADEAQKLLASFSDSAQSASWAKESMAACIQTGIISGMGGHTLAPRNEITRAEVAIMVQRLLQKSELI